MRVRRSSELPDDEGTVFFAWAPGMPCFITGRRSDAGELCVGGTYTDKDGGGGTLDELKTIVADNAEKHPGFVVEIVTGKEADDLFAAMHILTCEQERRRKRQEGQRRRDSIKRHGRVMPYFVFHRFPDVEMTHGYTLAGLLFVDIPKKKMNKKSVQDRILDLLTHIGDQRDRLLPCGVLIGWDGGYKPADGDAVTDDDELMDH